MGGVPFLVKSLVPLHPLSLRLLRPLECALSRPPPLGGSRWEKQSPSPLTTTPTMFLAAAPVLKLLVKAPASQGLPLVLTLPLPSLGL